MKKQIEISLHPEEINLPDILLNKTSLIPVLENR